KLRALRSYLYHSKTGWNADAFVPGPVLDAAKDEELCRVCQKRGALANEEGDPVCTHCLSDAKMGALLPRTRAVAFYNDQDTPGWRLPFGSIFFSADPLNVQVNRFLVIGLDGMLHEPSRLPVVPGFRSRHVPVDRFGNVCEFNTIADQSTGRKALACLKADVDNLGWVFRYGLVQGSEDRRSISRLSTLSDSFNHFFCGYLEKLLKTEFPWVYTVYSGGDDVLCLGPWDQVFRLSVRIREDFGKF